MVRRALVHAVAGDAGDPVVVRRKPVWRVLVRPVVYDSVLSPTMRPSVLPSVARGSPASAVGRGVNQSSLAMSARSKWIPNFFRD